MAPLARGDGAEDLGQRRVGDAPQLIQRHAGGEALQDVHHHGVGPALERIVEYREPHVAAVPGLAQRGVARQAVGPGVVDRVARLVGAEIAHDLEHALGVVGLLQRDPGGGDPGGDAGCLVDRVGEAGGGRELAVDEGRHQPQQLAAVAGGHIRGRGEDAALGEVVLDRHGLGVGHFFLTGRS